MTSFSESEIDEIREAFNLFDTDGSGTIDLMELKTAIHSLGLSIRNHSMYKIISDIEADGKGSVNFDEFVAILTSKLVRMSLLPILLLKLFIYSLFFILYSFFLFSWKGHQDSKEDYQKVFKLFDADSTGKISLQNLRRVANEIGETMSDAELIEMVTSLFYLYIFKFLFTWLIQSFL